MVLVAIQILKWFLGSVQEKVTYTYMILNALAMKRIYLNVYMMNLESTTVFLIMFEVLELAVVISLLIIILAVFDLYSSVL